MLARPLRSELVLRELTGGVKPARDPSGPRPKGRNPLPKPRQVSKAEAEAWAAADPYAKAGLFASVMIQEWKRVIG